VLCVWLKHLQNKWFGEVPVRKAAKRRGLKPRVETLEPRTLLSTIVTERIGGTQYLTILEPNGGSDGLGAIVRINPSNGTTQLVSDNAICGNQVFNHPTAMTLEPINGTNYLTMIDPTGGPDRLGTIVRINPYNGGSQLVSDNAICGNQVFNHPTELITEVTGSGTQYLAFLDPTGGPDGLGSIVRINEFSGGSQLVSDNAICGNQVFNHPTAMTLEPINGTNYLTMIDPTGGADGNGSVVRTNPHNGGSQMVSNYNLNITKLIWGQDGTAYVLATDHVLYVNGAPVKTLIEDFALTKKGAVLALDGAGELWYSATGLTWVESADGIAAFQVAPTGRVYALTTGGLLMFSDVGYAPYFSTSADGIAAFQVAPTGRVYALTTGGLLMFSDVGYAPYFSTCATGIASIVKDVAGNLRALTKNGVLETLTSTGSANFGFLAKSHGKLKVYLADSSQFDPEAAQQSVQQAVDKIMLELLDVAMGLWKAAEDISEGKIPFLPDPIRIIFDPSQCGAPDALVYTPDGKDLRYGDGHIVTHYDYFTFPGIDITGYPPSDLPNLPDDPGDTSMQGSGGNNFDGGNEGNPFGQGSGIDNPFILFGGGIGWMG
jgi:hypothetical protein